MSEGARPSCGVPVSEMSKKTVVGKFTDAGRKIHYKSEVSVHYTTCFPQVRSNCKHFRIVHAFTCAGILPSQYVHFSAHAKLGTLGAWYITSGVYKHVT